VEEGNADAAEPLVGVEPGQRLLLVLCLFRDEKDACSAVIPCVLGLFAQSAVGLKGIMTRGRGGRPVAEDEDPFPVQLLAGKVLPG